MVEEEKEWALWGKMFPTHCNIDNQIKALCDGMNEIVFVDDRFVNHLIVRREFGEEDRATMKVRSIG